MTLNRIKAFTLGEDSHDGSFQASVASAVAKATLFRRLLAVAIIVVIALGFLWAAIRILRWMWDTPIF
jgi:uncharacterized membrane protein YjgN (DUF898 family)